MIKTPQPRCSGDQKLRTSPLGKVMNKIGLQIGVNTGLNLNQLLVQD